ncbi:MAG: hypothetical protein ACT4QF_02445 [Sporichthyaceae bacterium]
MSVITLPNLDPKNATALFDKVVGLSREITGSVLQKDSWIEAGEAQQAKGAERLKALREQAKAEVHNQKARLHEQKASAQGSRQRAAAES